MTQVDLEALASVCGVGDRKITCETLADESQAQAIPESTVLDYAPESFWLSKDAEFDWFDRNAFLERKESIKGNSNSLNLNPISLFRFDCHGGRKSNKSVPEFNDPSEYSAPRRNNVTRNSFNNEQEATVDLAAVGGVTH
ncbi:hypothetical protein L1987_29524 [Smallanthus sonchifolius]|uniref:Uncharacterized protein n=1 Tax=Smallanthus sonchifolius TaxID=185202 RepID=A0ACB9I076_9ASTR|nr:hypothetical protein L1987_29524 [Smallanthus sonchifolius]